jgi:hypothetical protein
MPYFLKGTSDSRVDVVICVRSEMDCARLEARIVGHPMEIAKFPEEHLAAR